MRFTPLGLSASVALAFSAYSAQAQTAYPATLAGHAVLPAKTFIAASCTISS